MLLLSLLNLCVWQVGGAVAQGRGKGQAAKSCPAIQIFGARETTTPQGFGSAITLIQLIQQRFPGTVAEEIIYPALGDELYGQSVGQGIAAVVNQTSIFAARCPQSIIIMHGYSQGAQIMDDAFCGGPDLPQLESAVPLISNTTAKNTAAIILMGNPRHIGGLSFNAGNATAGGFAARPAGFKCAQFADRIQSYCDTPDPFCSNGNDAETHQQYGFKYGKEALDFIVSKLVAN